MKDWYSEIKDQIFENLCELIPVPDCPDSSVQNCQDGLDDLLEIREVVNYHIRATRRELKRRKDAGNPAVDHVPSDEVRARAERSGLSVRLIDFLEQRKKIRPNGKGDA